MKDSAHRLETVFDKQLLGLNQHDEAIANIQQLTKKLEITKIQMVGTLDELEEIGELNFNWASSMASHIEKL